MRWPVALLILLLPTASAASEVHVTYDGGAYVVGFESAGSPSVTVDGREVAAEQVNGTTWRSRLAPAGLTYAIDGRSFELDAPPSRTSATRIAFVADMGTSPDAKAVVAAIVAEDPDLVLIGGDLAYAHANDSIWSDWFTIMEPLAARVPILPAYGNHDDVCSTGNNTYRPCGAERERFHARFDLPGDDLFYAVNWGPARITSLDTEAWAKDEGQHPSGRAEQVSFLQSSLDEDDERWDLVMFHRPTRTTSTRDGTVLAAQASALEPTLADADLVLAAHLHAYERSKPAEGAPLYVTSGGGGRPLYDEWGPEPPWLATRAVEHHFLLLDVTPTRIDARAVRPDGSTLDSFTLEKPAPPTPATPTPHTTMPTVDPPPTSTSSDPPTTTGSIATTVPQETSIPFPLPLLAALLAALVAARRRAAR